MSASAVRGQGLVLLGAPPLVGQDNGGPFAYVVAGLILLWMIIVVVRSRSNRRR